MFISVLLGIVVTHHFHDVLLWWLLLLLLLCAVSKPQQEQTNCSSEAVLRHVVSPTMTSWNHLCSVLLRLA